MSLDPELIHQLSNRSLPDQSSVRSLVQGIHRQIGLREQVPLEAVALPPIPVVLQQRWHVLSLLALPHMVEGKIRGYYAPWGVVAWSWPEREVVQMLDLRPQATTPPPQLTLIENIPAGAQSYLDIDTQRERENALFAALDLLLASPMRDEEQLRSLASLYADLLPAPLYPYYWSQAPASEIWLQIPHASDIPQPRATTSVHAPIMQTLPAEHVDEQTDSALQPTDLSPRLDAWLRDALALAQTINAQEIRQHLLMVQQRLRLPGFRLAFVGEFNRGKSTLVNRLLDRPLLPVGIASTTTALTSVVFGTIETMEVRFPDREREQRPVSDASWADLQATSQQDEARTRFPQVRITLNHPWLEKLDAEFIDTPGVNDRNIFRSALASDVLSSTDAAILLVSARYAVSMTEAQFLEQEVIGKHVPHLLVVVSMLDTIAPEERELVMENVRDKIRAISPHTPVVATYTTEATATAVSSLQEVCAQIERLATQTDRRAWRSRQAAATIADDAHQLATLAQTALRAAHQSTADRARAARIAQEEANRAEQEWNLITLELLKHCDLLERELRHRLAPVQTRLLDYALFELARTPDPKAWWERDFPFRVRQDLLSLTQGAESLLISALEHDTRWLQQRVQTSFGFMLTFPAQPETLKVASALRQSEVGLTNLQQWRLFTRIGSGAATVVGYILLGPIGSAISIGAGILSDQALAHRIKEQQQLLENEARLSIERTVQEYITRVSERLQACYRQLIDDLHQQQRSWETSKTRLLEADNSAPTASTAPNEHAWQQVIEAATQLSQDIQTALTQR